MSNKIAIFSPSHYCNSQCWMCTDLWTDISTFVEPDFDMICEEVSALKHSGVTSLHISGGEPTVWRRFDEFLEFVRQLKFSNVAVYTNGRTLTKRKVLHCLENGVNLFLVSLHAANPEDGDEIANAPNSFKQTLKGLSVLSDFKDQYDFEVSISCVPSLITQTSLHEIAQIACSFNIDNFHISYPVNTSFANPINRMLFPDLKVLKKGLNDALQTLLAYGVTPVINEIPPCYYREYLSYYSAAYEHSQDRILIGFHSQDGKVTKDNYFPLESSKMNYHPRECSECYLKGICHGIPVVYKNLYQQGELLPFSAIEIEQYVQSRNEIKN